jgi:PAS domain S-box-containing protein
LSVEAQDNSLKKVLVLHSYHHGLSWVESIGKGIESALKKTNLNIEIYSEYMDTKRIYDPIYIGLLHETYKHKFKSSQFGLIICSDNNALNFLLRYRDKIFSKTPVVFCGINSFNDSMLEHSALFTGTVEDINIRDTIDTALKLHPETKNIYVYGVDTTTYFANKERLEAIIPDYKGSIEFTFVEYLNIKQVQNSIKKLTPNSMILILSSISDEQGHVLPFKQEAEMMSSVSSVPIYSCWDFFLGNGIVGGKLISGFAQGETAGKIALRILNGESIKNIPVLKKSPNRFMFDDRQMKCFCINESQLPEGSIIINKPLSFYTQHKRLIWGTGTIIAGLLFIVLTLVINTLKRKHIEEALRESEERFRAIIETARDSIFIKNRDLKYTLVNPGMERLFGMQASQLLGKTDEELFGDEAGDHIRKVDSRVLAGEIVEEEHVKPLNGILTTFHVIKVPIRDSSGNITGLCGIARNISEIKRLESQLQHAQKMESIGTLAGGIAHDFNNLLMGLQGNASLALLDIDPNHPLHERLKNIEEYVQSGAELTRQLLGFAMGGKFEVRPVNINNIIRTGSKMFGRTKKEIKIYRKCQKHVWMMEADQGQIEQVLLNLYVNAWQAMPEGGELNIQTENVILQESFVKPYNVKPGKYVKISVADTGIGIDATIQKRIFDPFFTTREMGRGTGLGLASAYGIITNHEGIINVHSKTGAGTTFDIYLPASEKEFMENKKTPKQMLKGSETILIVDDEQMIVDVAAIISIW